MPNFFFWTDWGQTWVDSNVKLEILVELNKEFFRAQPKLENGVHVNQIFGFWIRLNKVIF